MFSIPQWKENFFKEGIAFMKGQDVPSITITVTQCKKKNFFWYSEREVNNSFKYNYYSAIKSHT
jgi:hypothetical protein